MKKIVIPIVLLFLLFSAANAVAALLPAGTLLTIAPGLVIGTDEADLISGSAFAMGDGIGQPPGQQIDPWTAVLPGTDGGLILGITQVRKGVDKKWNFFNNPGWHYTSAAPTADDANGSLDFTGWTVFWNGGDIPMGDSTSYTFTNNGNGTYQINGVKVVSHPTDPNFTFNGVVYTLHLEGNIVPVPEPASLLLVSTGLAGLVGLARRRNKK